MAMQRSRAASEERVRQEASACVTQNPYLYFGMSEMLYQMVQALNASTHIRDRQEAADCLMNMGGEQCGTPAR
jgi:hypothetical protein